MNIVYNGNLEFDAAIVPVYEDVKIECEDKQINEMIQFIFENGFKGKREDIESFKLAKEGVNKVVLVGLGKKEELDFEKIRKVASKGFKAMEKLKPLNIKLAADRFMIEGKENESAKAVAEAIYMSDYKFDDYLADKKESKIENISICTKAEVEDGVKEGISTGKANIIARKLVNEPSNILTPEELANRVLKLGEEVGFEVEVFEEEKINELKMEAYMSVAKASHNRPRFIVMRYFGDEANKEEIFGLVGKGLTYDSGGLSIKPTNSMLNMKSDMGGSAAVIGAMSAIVEQKLKVNVVAVVAACENSIAGNAYRPGDIIGSMAGKTILIKNTDAEGRLTLIDAMHYIIENEKATRVVDIATLTGAVISALGNVATGIVSNDDEFFNKLNESAKLTGEKIWRLPVFDEYKELLKGGIADLTNQAGNPGTITAGLFIGEFVQERPWIHMDIAGTSFINKDKDYISKGGTGAGARNLYELVKMFQK